MTDIRWKDNPQLVNLNGLEVIAATSISGGTDTSAGTVAPGADIKIPLSQALSPKINTTITSNTVTPNSFDRLIRPAALTAATTFANPTTAPPDGWVFVFDFIDDGTARALTWGGKYAGQVSSLPTTTVAGKRHRVNVEYNLADDKYYCISATVEGGTAVALSIQTVTSASTVTPVCTNDKVVISAQAAALTIANPSGTAVDGNGFVITLKDNGTARAITFGSSYRAMGAAALPTTTVAGKWHYISCEYNAIDSKWDVLPMVTQQ